MENIRGTVNPADLMTKHLDGMRLTTLRDLLSMKQHVSGRPNSAPKLAIDTEHIAQASRSLAAMPLVKQAAANEIAVFSGSDSVEWIN